MTRTSMSLIVLAAGILAFLTLPHAGAPQDKGPMVKTIPLDTVYTTSDQKGFKARIKGNPYDTLGKNLSQLMESVQGGAPNVFLVRGDTIADAVYATYQVYTHNRPLAGPPSPTGVDPPAAFRVHKEMWLFVYFGQSTTNPTVWVVESVEQQGKTLRVKYHTPEFNQFTANLRHYFIWAPLGQLEPGEYSVELFATDRKKTVMTRLITVDKTP